MEMADGTEDIHFAVMNRGACARTVAVLHAAILALVGMRPQQLAGRFLEAQHTFLLGIELAVGNVNAPLGHDRPRIAGTDGSAPADVQALLGKRINDAGLLPDAIAIGA